MKNLQVVWWDVGANEVLVCTVKSVEARNFLLVILAGKGKVTS